MLHKAKVIALFFSFLVGLPSAVLSLSAWLCLPGNKYPRNKEAGKVNTHFFQFLFPVIV